MNKEEKYIRNSVISIVVLIIVFTLIVEYAVDPCKAAPNSGMCLSIKANENCFEEGYSGYKLLEDEKYYCTDKIEGEIYSFTE